MPTFSLDKKSVSYWSYKVKVVPKERIELSRHCWRGILNPLRLPFRHLGTNFGAGPFFVHRTKDLLSGRKTVGKAI